MATRPFLKGSFFAKGLFCNESPTNENERFVNAFHRPRLLLLCGLSVVRGNYKRGEQRAHQNGKGERREVEKKHFCARFSKGKRCFESPSSFEGPGTSCNARVKTVLPRPSAAMSIRKRSLSSSMHTPPTSKYYSHQVAILCPSKYTKMYIIASDFQKFPGGARPRTPQRDSGFAQAFAVCTQVDWCLEMSLAVSRHHCKLGEVFLLVSVTNITVLVQVYVY